MRKLAKQHGYKLRPARKSFSSTFRTMFPNQSSEFRSWEMLQQLIEQTRDRYHGTALLDMSGRIVALIKFRCADGLGGLFNWPLSQNRTLILDGSGHRPRLQKTRTLMLVSSSAA